MTAITPNCIVLTADDKFLQHIEGSLLSITKVIHVTHDRHLDRFIRQSTPFLILLDIRIPDLEMVLNMINSSPATHLIVGFGDLRSDQMLTFGSTEFYAHESLFCEISKCQQLVNRALEHLKIKFENTLLHQNTLSKLSHSSQVSLPHRDSSLPLRHLHRSFRNFHDIDTLFENSIEGFASAAMLSRAGIFARLPGSRKFNLRASIRCLEVTEQTEYSESDPFVRWLEINGCMISRSNLEHIQSPSEKIILKQALDTMGAEAIIPIHIRSGIMGWILIGSRATGIPFKYSELEEFVVATENISTNLENAALYEEVKSQKALLEALIQSIPNGIVAINSDSKICWFNHTAEILFKVTSEEVMNKPIEVLGSRMADIMRRTMEGNQSTQSRQWREPLSQKNISVQPHYLVGEKSDLGVVAIVQDVTTQKLLEEKEKQIQRNKFWRELATNISHHIRNPLVTIRTFAQLLPERYDDPDFRENFWKLVPQEIERLDKMIDQVDTFAHPPERVFTNIEVKDVLKKSIEIARFRILPQQIKIDLQVAENLPKIVGDDSALSECFAQILSNAIEATSSKSQPEIHISADLEPNSKDLIALNIRDNGKGIPPEIQGELFSPFCTTKATGMGLGLPVAQRTIFDHNGAMNIQTGGLGTCITVHLPLNPHRNIHESYSHH